MESVNDAKPGQVQKYMIDQLAALGLTDQQIAGILTNIDQESGFDPTAKESGGTGEGRGLAQWGVNARFAELSNWAKKHNKDPWAAETQVEFMIREMQGKHKWANFNMADFKKTKSVKDAAAYFGEKYEAFGVAGDRYDSSQMEHWLGRVKKVRSTLVDSSKAVGDWDVSRDQTSRIHAGEMILPAQFASAVREALSGSGIGGGRGVVNVNVTLMNSGQGEANRLVKYVATEIDKQFRLSALAEA